RRDAHGRKPDRHRPKDALRPSADGCRDAGPTIRRRERNHPFALADALERARDSRALLLVNAKSGRASVQVPAPSLMLDDGEVERRVRLLRPMERPAISLANMAQSHWRQGGWGGLA